MFNIIWSGGILDIAACELKEMKEVDKIRARTRLSVILIGSDLCILALS